MNTHHETAPTTTPTHPPLPDALVGALQAQFGSRFSVAESVRAHHGRDESVYPAMPPQGVVYPESTDEVVALVKLCRAHCCPLIPWGAGSSIEGQLLAVQGGISVDLSRMNRVLEVAAEDLLASVQPGVTRKQLNQEIRDTGLFFPIDPGADASIGGMVATRASGTNAVRYGTLRDNVLALTVVTADGQVVRTGTRARKSSAGYDLTRLFVGSEGTLGIITEITLRLHPLPEAVSAAVVNFPTAEKAVTTVIEAIQLGIPVARCEFLDAAAIRAINAYSKLSLREAPTLFFEFHGSETAVAEQAALVQELAAGNDGADFEWATQPEERTRLWNARHDAYFAGLQMRPGARAIATDTCVPISRLAESLEGARTLLEASGFPSMILGHVGDGNFHCLILVDADNPEEMARAEALNHEIVALGLRLGGTCTGEHGIGLHKMDFLREETGDEAVALMARIKQALDPDGILNPGKIFVMPRT
ncbi:MAG: FAD-linked oxidase C-terminal domain-containing protein [Lautropia sp.]|nr:FAD-linked oxidase C-terminal domain-containing protein [Lautropia sp.]